MKLRTEVEISREEIVTILTEQALEKAGRHQGASTVRFLVDGDGHEIIAAVITFNGTAHHK